MPSHAELNAMLARSEDERLRFDRMDADLDWPGFEGGPPLQNTPSTHPAAAVMWAFLPPCAGDRCIGEPVFKQRARGRTFKCWHLTGGSYLDVLGYRAS